MKQHDPAMACFRSPLWLPGSTRLQLGSQPLMMGRQLQPANHWGHRHSQPFTAAPALESCSPFVLTTSPDSPAASANSQPVVQSLLPRQPGRLVMAALSAWTAQQPQHTPGQRWGTPKEPTCAAATDGATAGGISAAATGVPLAAAHDWGPTPMFVEQGCSCSKK